MREEREHMAAGHSEDGHPWDKTPSHNATQLKGCHLSIQQLPAGLCFACLSSALALALLPSALSSSATSQLHPTAGPQPLPSFSLPSSQAAFASLHPRISASCLHQHCRFFFPLDMLLSSSSPPLVI